MKPKIMQFNKTILLVICVGLVLFYAGCDNYNPFQVDSTKYRAEESFSFTVNPDNQDHLTLTAINGSVEVIGVAGSDVVEISGLRIVNSESASDAEKYLEKLDVNIRINGDKVEVETEQPSNSGGREFIVEYQIRMPAEWDFELNHTNGEVEVDSIAGTVDINNVNGNIGLHETRGNLFIDLTNGQVTGKVSGSGVGVCRFSLVNGQIGLSIPKATDASFSAAVTNGRVSVNNLVMTNLTSRQNSVRGTIGNGQGEITLRVINGNIDVAGY